MPFDGKRHAELEQMAFDHFGEYEDLTDEFNRLCADHTRKIYPAMKVRRPSVRELERMNRKPHFLRHEDCYVGYRVIANRFRFYIRMAFIREFKSAGGRIYAIWFENHTFFYSAHLFDRLIQRGNDEVENRYQAIKIILEEWLLLIAYGPELANHIKLNWHNSEEGAYADLVVPNRLGLALGVTTQLEDDTYVSMLKTFVSEDMLRHNQQYKHYLPFIADIERVKSIKVGVETYNEIQNLNFNVDEEKSS